MKKIILASFILLGGNQLVNAQTEFEITFNAGYAEKPTYSALTKSDAISAEKLESAFDFLVKESKLEFNYSYGSCEDRAHAISLMLSGKGIKTKKIWNFDPYYISLFNSQQQLSAPDKSGLNDVVKWGFHVAPVALVEKNNKTELVVIDPSIDNKPVSVKEWLDAQNADNSHYMFTDSRWLSFLTINGFTYNNHAIPSNFPTLLTGDFYQNKGENLEKMWVAEGLAVNDMAIHIVKQIVNKDGVESEVKERYKTLASNIDALTKALRNEFEEEEASQYLPQITELQKQFVAKRKSWRKILDELRGKTQG